jgi:hypothetical protein
MNDARTYERIFQAFDATHKKVVGFAELQRAMSSLPDSESMGRKRFFRYLLRQKWHEHVLLRFFRTSFTTVLAGLMAYLSERRSRPATTHGRTTR